MSIIAEQPKEFTALTIFKNSCYTIPIYQRNYAWGKDEIEQLLNDISDTEGKYCIGSLIVDKKSEDHFTVIDGQQRLTTLFLLLVYLKNESVNVASLRFEARGKSNLTLSDISKNGKPTQSDSYSEEIVSGYNIIESYFETECVKDSHFKEKFEDRLNSISIIRTQVPKKIDLNHYFEIMNTRGEQLEIHEIAKGRLLSVISDANDRSIAATLWDSCAKMYSYIQMNFSKDIREKLFGSSWSILQSKNFSDIRKCFEGKNYGSATRFSLKQKLDNPQSASDNHNGSNENEENERFESIVSFPNFLLLVNEALNFSANENDSSLDDKHFLKTLKQHWENNNAALSFIFNLLKMRFLFDTYIIKREFAKDYQDEGKWTLQRLESYDDGQKKPLYKSTFSKNAESENFNSTTVLLQSALRITYTAPKTMHWISLVLSELSKNEAVDIIEILEKYSCQKVQKADYKNAKGFAIDRIVFTYLDYVLLRDKKVDMPDFYFQFRTSIEHFYPQNPIDGIKWKNDDLNSFGNLALITVSSNSKFSNLPPSSKADSYPYIILQSPKLKLMEEMMKKNGKWTEKISQKHNDEMISLLDSEIERRIV